MKEIIYILMLFFSLSLVAQKETSNWYFGKNAGLNFSAEGTVSLNPDGKLNTGGGCSVMSDAWGNLLFYTDGRSVWDRNHKVMPNGNYLAGTGLHGDPESSQSCVIVPKKGNPQIYYIFTIDQPHYENAAVYPDAFTGEYYNATGRVPADDDGRNNGFNYSVIDLSITGTNGSMGDITLRNKHLTTYNPLNENEVKYKCSEKVAAVVTHDYNGVWVMTHFINKFYAFKVDVNGVTETPVITQIAPFIPLGGYTANAKGCLKFSPNGKKLAIAHHHSGTLRDTDTGLEGQTYLYDFDNVTGEVTNAIMLNNAISPSGVEFSPESKKLYVEYPVYIGHSERGGLTQYNLLADDIQASAVRIGSGDVGSLQLALNGKIYQNVHYSNLLNVIDNPEADGTFCNFLSLSQTVGEAGIIYSGMGLPNFSANIFSPAFSATSDCEGSLTHFEFSANNDFTSISWDFGDGSPASTQVNPAHNYSSHGTYIVKATVVRNTVTEVIQRQVTIYQKPVIAMQPQNLFECARANAGVAKFRLRDNDAIVLGSQSSSQFKVNYFTSQLDADKFTNAIHDSIVNEFENTGNPQIIYVRVHNRANMFCYAVSSFSIGAANNPKLTNAEYTICDDDTDGNSANGQAMFNLTDVIQQFLPNPNDFILTYHKNAIDAQASTNPLPTNFYNTIPNEQTIFVRIASRVFTCTTVQNITLKVNKIAMNYGDFALTKCDDPETGNGYKLFDLTLANAHFTEGFSTLTVDYYTTAATAHAADGSLPLSYGNTSNPQVIYARIYSNSTGCYRVAPLKLEVIPVVNVAADALIKKLDVVDFSQNSAVTIYPATPGNYLYSLDAPNGPFVSSNYFDKLSSGPHTAYVYDNENCTIASKDFIALSIPSFFTPNGDGKNDTWNIIGVNALFYANSKIYIFDRFGKMLANVDPRGQGWNGIYNGLAMPSADYWYVIQLQDGRTVKGHFSLMR